ncbi:MAG: hypothetical protein AB7J19_08375, partial [Beijerinckiaceae bacterium]
MFEALDSIWVFYLCLFGAVIAAVDAIYSLVAPSSMYRRQVNDRLSRLEKDNDRVKTMLDLRRDRGLSLGGAYRLPAVWLNRLIVQSGVTVGVARIGMAAAGLALAATAAGYYFGGLKYAFAGLVGGGLLLPLFALMYLRRRRVNKFTEQFAEAIEIIVRSLRAGHPV